jgi:hypothetical protein
VSAIRLRTGFAAKRKWNITAPTDLFAPLVRKAKLASLLQMITSRICVDVFVRGAYNPVIVE